MNPLMNSSPYASFAVLYAKNIFLVFVLSGLCTVIVCVKRNRFSQIAAFVEKHALKFLIVLVLGDTVLFSALCIMRHLSFHSHGADLGIYTQVIYNTSTGNFMDSSLDGVNYLGKHVILSTLLLVPFYKLFPSPLSVLILQAFFLAMGSVALYLLAHHIFQRKFFGVIFAFLYLMSAPLHYITLYDFHPDIFSTAPFLFAFYFLTVKKKLPYYLFLLVAILSKEQFSLIGFMFGLFQIFFARERFEGFMVCVLSALWFYLCIFVIVPHFLQKPYFFFEAYDYLGKNFSERIHTLFFQPAFVLKHVLTPVKIAYVFLLLFPLAFLPLFNLRTFALALPTLAINLLGDEKHIHYHSIFFQYNASILPFLYISSVYSLSFMKQKKSPWLVPAFAFISFQHIFFSYYFGPAPWSKSFMNPDYKVAQFRTLDYSYKSYVPAKNAEALREAVAQIPAGVSVVAQSDIVPHVVNRRDVYFFPSFIEKAQYVIIDTKGNTWPVAERAEYDARVTEFKKSKNFTSIFSKDGVMIFKRK